MAQRADRGRTKPGNSRDGIESYGERASQDIARLGNIPTEGEDGTMRILVSQMGGCASVESREIKISGTNDLIRQYDINLCAFMELNFN